MRGDFGNFIIILIPLVWNALLFVLVYVDKFRARHALQRIPESFFLWSAFLMGAGGIWAGMYIFRHKTRKWKFYLFVPVLFFLNVAVIWGILAGVGE